MSLAILCVKFMLILWCNGWRLRENGESNEGIIKHNSVQRTSTLACHITIAGFM